jgi:hypothetical protein
VDLNKKEIYDTWKPGPDTEINNVLDITFGRGNIYAATDRGIYYADASNPGLSYFGNWNPVTAVPEPYAAYNLIAFSGNNIYVNKPDQSGDYIYAVNGTSSIFSFTPGIHNRSLDISSGGFTVSSSSTVIYYNADGTHIKTINAYSWGAPDFSQAIADNGDIWIADLRSGLVRGADMNDFSKLDLPGPVSNNVYDITSLNGKTIISAGGADNSWNSMLQPLELSIHENSKWTPISSGSITDALRTLIDPDNINHIYVSSWGRGLVEYIDNNIVNHYTEDNSPLQTSVPGQPFVRINGLAMDKWKNLWITQSGVRENVKVLKPDGSWIVNPITIGAPVIGDIIITKAGHKWIILPLGHGLFILDDNNTPENFSDDRSIKLSVRDNDNALITSVNSIAEDLDGNIWIGTDQGPLVYYLPERVFGENLTAFRIKIPRNDGSGLADYILKTESITSLAIDGANRKWLGTAASGVYHLAADGTSLLKNFNEQNSPLFSDSIIDIAIDNKTGDVWFGTSRGVQSFRGDASGGSKAFTNVYTFPNPVREDFTGNVTITGLMRDTQIRITDISGNLVYETVSDGGMATWDLRTYNGRRVATGIYIVFCASEDGSQSTVTKMLVVN